MTAQYFKYKSEAYLYDDDLWKLKLLIDESWKQLAKRYNDRLFTLTEEADALCQELTAQYYRDREDGIK